MSNTTIALRSSGATGNVPNALSLAYGEFALNYADGIIYYRTDSNTIGSILTTQPSGLDKEIQFNDLGSFGSSANLSFNKTTGLLSTYRINVAANVQIAGNVTASKLISNNSIGDSGGEILLAKPAANTTLSGLGITIDAFQNKIRFYEQGGTNRGAYIDLTEASANVGTNLLTAGGGGGNNALQYRSSYTANGGQTVFAATYIPGYVDTFINGVKLTPSTDFTATNGTTITLGEGAVANDSVEIIGYVTVSTTLPDAIQHRYSYTANAAQTTFAAIYVAPYVDVYKNGGRLSFGDDFIANNGTTVVLTTGAALDDLIEIVGYSSYTVTEVTADELTTGRTIGMTGDVVWTSNSFNGTANVTGTSTLANTGVTAGTYTKVTVDAKGRVTTGNTLSFSDLPSYSGNLVFTGTGNRILGDFSNATVANRVAFQTSTANTITAVAIIPNGTSNSSQLNLETDSAQANGTSFQFIAGAGFGTEGRLQLGIRGTGTYLPMTFYTGGSERVRIDTSGNVGIGLANPGHKLQVAGTAFIGGVANTDATLNVIPGSGTKGKTGFTVYGATFGASWGGGDTGVRTTFRTGANNTGTDSWTTMVYDIDSNQQDATSWVNRFRINGNTGDVLLGINGGNVGIGTSSPAYKLDVRGGVLAVGNGTITGGFSYSTRVEMGSISNHNLGFIVNNTTQMILDTSGNLGLGVTPSASSTTGSGRAIQFPNGFSVFGQATGGDAFIASNAYNSAANTYTYVASSLGAGRYQSDFGTHRWFTAPSGTAGNAISFTQAATLTAAGDYLVGTTTSRGRLTSESPTNTTPALYAYNTSAVSGSYSAVFALGANNNNTSSFFLNCTEPGVANRFAIYGNGTYATLSDRRIKKNIETTREGYLDDVMRLRVVKYNWVSQEDGEAKELGVIAQELEQVFPGLIQESKAEGADTTYKQIKSSVIPFILLKAIQELKAEFDAYKATHP